jgi:hypothetical protein
MGNQTSSQNERPHEKRMRIIDSDEKMIQLSTGSSYKGFKSELSSSSESPKDIDTDTSSHTEDVKVKTTFEWKEGGKNVYITGSFANWSQLFAMNKCGSGSFELCLVSLCIFT